MIADSINVKLSGLTKACLVAKNDPAKPPNVAPIAKAVKFSISWDLLQETYKQSHLLLKPPKLYLLVTFLSLM